MTITRRILSGMVLQGTDESRTYIADLTKWATDWGAPISVISNTLYDRKTQNDESSKLSGVATINGNLVESKMVSGLVANTYYRMNILILFPDDQQLSGYWLIKGEL